MDCIMESLGDPADPHSKPRIFRESLSNIFLKTDSVKSNAMPPKKRMNVSSNVASSNVSSPLSTRKLMPHQLFVRDFLGADKPQRGLLLYHGLGSGKTCAAIAIAASLVQDDRAPQKKVIVMLPANLHTNFDSELQPCGLSSTEVHYIHYNGVSDVAVVRILKDSSFFNNAVIIIDEAHNFALAAANGGVLARFYKRIVDAHDSRVVLLSGTPLVNSPHEVAFIVNMARGVQNAYTIPLQRRLSDTDMQALSKCPYVKNAVSTTIGRALQSAVTIQLAPEHFKYTTTKKSNNKVPVLETGEDGKDGNRWMDRATDAVMRIIGDNAGGRTRFPAPERILPLPDDKNAFEARFMDTGKGQIKSDSKAQLESAMSECISYFEGHDQSLYPALRKFVMVRTHMSRHQFAEYSYQRALEIRREKAARVRARISKTSSPGDTGGDGGGGMVYRPFSRAVCNFAFPHDVPRPYKENGGDKYEKQLSDTIETLSSQYPERLRPSRQQDNGYTLDTLSPKFANVLRYLTAHPHQMSIVYSQFRTVEGVGIFASVLKVNGFGVLECRKDEKTGELRVHSDVKGAGVRRYMVWGANGKEGDELLLSIYNNKLDGLSASVKKDLKALNGNGGNRANNKITNLHGEIVCVLFVSKAGAEGISTSNVREVHVLEPFWHANRIEQVVGRARRAHSHDGLPSNERNVDVYVHLSTFTAEQAKLHKDVDQGKSSDEHVHDIAQKKRGILREIQGVMKKVSVNF